MTSLILITIDNGRGHCAYWQSCKVPNKTHRGIKQKRKTYAIKQIKICAEYQDMLPRPRLDLSGTPGLRPIGLGSWQTSLGLRSMSRYSAQILICITRARRKSKSKSCHIGRRMAVAFVLMCLPSTAANYSRKISLHLPVYYISVAFMFVLLTECTVAMCCFWK